MSRDLKQFQRAKDIVARYRERGTIPREQRDRTDPAKRQEYRDACKIKIWKYALMGNEKYSCSDEVRDYLDENMPGWRERVYSHQGKSSSTQMRKAREIVERYRERGCVRPRRNNDPSRHQENKDAIQLNTWRSAIRGQNQVTCSADLRNYLDDNMPGWSRDHIATVAKNVDITTQQSKNMNTSMRRESLVEGEKHSNRCNGTIDNNFTVVNLSGKSIILRDKDRQTGGTQMNIDGVEIEQPKHRTKPADLSAEAMLSSSSHGATFLGPAPVQKALHLDLAKAQDIVQRCYERAAEGKGFLPRLRTFQPSSPDMILDQIYAEELHGWKMALLTHGEDAGSTTGGIRWELKSYLDKELGDWLSITDVTSDEFSQSESFSVSESGSSIDVQASECEREMDTFDQVNVEQSIYLSSDLPDGTTSQSYSSSNTSPDEDGVRLDRIGVTDLLKKGKVGGTSKTCHKITEADIPSPYDIEAVISKNSSSIHSKYKLTPEGSTSAFNIIDRGNINSLMATLSARM